MTPPSDQDKHDGFAEPNPRRRPRYQGSHPRRFEERYKELDSTSFPEMQSHILAQGRTPAGSHVPVLVNEVMEFLRPRAGDEVADCTLGYGGHALAFLSRIGATGRLVGLDVDGAQLERAAARIRSAGYECVVGESKDAAPPVVLYRTHYAGLPKLMSELGIAGFDIIFADLGVSSMQIDDPRRGFSYKFDGPLDMRMDDRVKRTAADWIAGMLRNELCDALLDFADEPDHEAIARAIVHHREREPITTTRQLVKIVFKAKRLSWSAWKRRSMGSSQQVFEDHESPTDVNLLEKPSRLHPAALTFQALRILVNDELSGLSQLLRIAPHCLRPGGRLGIISFHSGEDRLVKNALKKGLQIGQFDSIAESPIRPSPSELHHNPRSASAKFRWARAATVGL